MYRWMHIAAKSSAKNAVSCMNLINAVVYIDIKKILLKNVLVFISSIWCSDHYSKFHEMLKMCLMYI